MSKKKFKPLEIKKEDEKEMKQVVTMKAMTATQQKYIDDIKENDIIFCNGPSGSGKTFIAVGMALQGLLSSQFSRIIAVRPIIESGPSIGYLPGDIHSKTKEFMSPIFIDSMEAFISKAQISNLEKENKVQTLALGFARGRSLSNAIILCDEMQNSTCDQCLLLLTRLAIGENGKGSKMIFSGDLDQSDIKGKNGLQDAFERLQNISRIAFVEMTTGDIVRHPLIKEILSRYRQK